MEEMKKHEEQSYMGYKIVIFHDEGSENPRSWGYNLGTIYTNLKKYNPDGHTIEELIESIEFLDKNGDFKVEKLDKEYIYLNVYSIISDGIDIRCGEQYAVAWDSAWFGIIAVQKKEALKRFNRKNLSRKFVEEIKGYLSDEIETLNQYYNGEVYGYLVYDREGNTIDLGDGYYMLENAYAEARFAVRQHMTVMNIKTIEQ